MALNEWWKSGTSMISSVGGGGGAGSSVVTLWSSRPASNWSPSHDIHRTVHMSTSPVAPLLHHSGADICRRVSSSAGHYHRSIRALSQSAMSDEAAKAQTAGPEKETIFGKILKGELPTKFIYEDDKVCGNFLFFFHFLDLSISSVSPSTISIQVVSNFWFLFQFGPLYLLFL